MPPIRRRTFGVEEWASTLSSSTTCILIFLRLLYVTWLFYLFSLSFAKDIIVLAYPEEILRHRDAKTLFPRVHSPRPHFMQCQFQHAVIRQWYCNRSPTNYLVRLNTHIVFSVEPNSTDAFQDG